MAYILTHTQGNANNQLILLNILEALQTQKSPQTIGMRAFSLLPPGLSGITGGLFGGAGGI
ncbi:hypothetical protein [Serratia odorifera]|uniref:hypothetical protein n=1 Tax=Serratia odorifera TaxID=618 RepID=UPI0018E7227C|nr:hypothetical protein [Serratia odorifera]MBJ2067490.1 hypothetical protein [Serratia odorifera]